MPFGVRVCEAPPELSRSALLNQATQALSSRVRVLLVHLLLRWGCVAAVLAVQLLLSLALRSALGPLACDCPTHLWTGVDRNNILIAPWSLSEFACPDRKVGRLIPRHLGRHVRQDSSAGGVQRPPEVKRAISRHKFGP